jgi:hypothetical protein
MPTYYVRYRKTGPTGVFSVIANNREAAVALVTKTAAAGEEFDITDMNTIGYADVASVTGPTGPSGITGNN